MGVDFKGWEVPSPKNCAEEIAVAPENLSRAT